MNGKDDGRHTEAFGPQHGWKADSKDLDVYSLQKLPTEIPERESLHGSLMPRRPESAPPCVPASLLQLPKSLQATSQAADVDKGPLQTGCEQDDASACMHSRKGRLEQQRHWLSGYVYEMYSSQRPGPKRAQSASQRRHVSCKSFYDLGIVPTYCCMNENCTAAWQASQVWWIQPQEMRKRDFDVVIGL